MEGVDQKEGMAEMAKMEQMLHNILQAVMENQDKTVDVEEMEETEAMADMEAILESGQAVPILIYSISSTTRIKVEQEVTEVKVELEVREEKEAKVGRVSRHIEMTLRLSNLEEGTGVMERQDRKEEKDVMETQGLMDATRS